MRVQQLALIAFTGFSRCGKDEAAQPLFDAGWPNYTVGSIIKRQLDPIVRSQLGFSAFTEIPSEKNLIRPVLETWGDANASNILPEFFANLPTYCVHKRLCRVCEAQEWKRRGGIVVEIRRTVNGVRCKPATPWEFDRMTELWESQMIDVTIENNGSIEELQAVIRGVLVEPYLEWKKSDQGSNLDRIRSIDAQNAPVFQSTPRSYDLGDKNILG